MKHTQETPETLINCLAVGRGHKIAYQGPEGKREIPIEQVYYAPEMLAALRRAAIWFNVCYSEATTIAHDCGMACRAGELLESAQKTARFAEKEVLELLDGLPAGNEKANVRKAAAGLLWQIRKLADARLNPLRRGYIDPDAPLRVGACVCLDRFRAFCKENL